jgi:hypothetical protein
LYPRETHIYGSGAAEDATSELQEDESGLQAGGGASTGLHQQGAVQDTYAWIGHISPALLAVLGAAADYYPLHCFTRCAHTTVTGN